MAWTDRLGSQLGPLTTTWTMPDSCSIFAVACPTCTRAYGGQQCMLKSGTAELQDHTTCWPPMTRDAGVNEQPFNGWGFYSPGLACPAGYTSACTAEYGKRGGWEIQFRLDPGETAVGCCPEGFRCTNIVGNTCVFIASSTTTVPTASCGGTLAEMANVGQGTFPDLITMTETTSDSTTVKTITRELFMLAPMFQLNYRATDLGVTSTTLPSSGLTLTTPTPTASNALLPATTQVGLSTGAAVGLGIGAALGGMLIATIAFATWVFLKKRKYDAATAAASAAEAEQLSYGYNGDESKYATASYTPHYTQQPHAWTPSELQEQGLSQMWAPAPPAEMPAAHEYHHLDGSSTAGHSTAGPSPGPGGRPY